LISPIPESCILLIILCYVVANNNKKVRALRNKNTVSRRRFLKSSGALTGASLLRIGTPALIAITEAACSAKQEAAPFANLNAADAADLAAIAARIMPTTDTPGATEAGVIYFIDRALGAEMQGMLEGLQAGLKSLNSRVTNQHTGTGRFAELDDGSQDELLTTIESGGFFNSLWMLTISGFFAMSSYGGNKDNIAWELIDFDGNHGAWEYPFGHYDAEYATEKSNG
jgi:gluconate 2-dehydrogenase gamma chain